MKKHIFMIIFMLFSVTAFCKTTEQKGDLNNDGVDDILITESSHYFDSEEDFLNINVKVLIKLMNIDGSILKEIAFSENRVFYDDEYDGGLGYSIKITWF